MLRTEAEVRWLVVLLQMTVHVRYAGRSSDHE